jgi:hypothetical protein
MHIYLGHVFIRDTRSDELIACATMISIAIIYVVTTFWPKVMSIFARLVKVTPNGPDVSESFWRIAISNVKRKIKHEDTLGVLDQFVDDQEKK